MLAPYFSNSSERDAVPELCSVVAVGALHRTVLRRTSRSDEVVGEVVVCARHVEGVESWAQGVGRFRVPDVPVREDCAVVGLHRTDGERSSGTDLREELHRGPGGLLRSHPQVPPPGAAINGGELVEPRILEFPRVHTVHLNQLSGNCGTRFPALLGGKSFPGAHQPLSPQNLCNPARRDRDPFPAEQVRREHVWTQARFLPEGADARSGTPLELPGV